MNFQTHFVHLRASTLLRWLLIVVILGLSVSALPATSTTTYGYNPLNSNPNQTITTSLQTPHKVGATRLHPTDSTKQLQLAISLHGQDETGLAKFLTDLYDTASPSYHQYLTPAQFDARFGPSQTSRSQLAKFLQAKSFQVNDSGTGTIVNATATVGQINTAFGLTIYDYQDATGRVFFANDLTPALPTNLSGVVLSIVGLSNQQQIRPHIVSSAATSSNVTPHGGTFNPADCSSANNGGFTPDQLATAYDMNPFYSANYSGTGQTMAVFELADYQNSDISTFEGCFPYINSSVPISRVLVDGGPSSYDNQQPNAQAEVELDMEVALGLVPNLGKLLVYEAPNSGNTDTYTLDNYQKMATDRLAQVISTSWGGCELSQDTDLLNGEFAIFQQLAAQGQSVFAAAGDTGASDCDGDPTHPTNAPAVDDPGSQPYVTDVGGTTLQVNSSNAYASESVWNGSGGGLSTLWKKAGWQVGTGVNNTYSNGYREVPDVTADGNPGTGYTTYIQGSWTVVGGTSASAPLWATQAVLTNQYLVANGKSNIGFANPVLYQVFNSSSLPYAPYHDITVGSNTYVSGVGYPATVGYDLASGVGSFDGWNLARDLKTLGAPPPTLYVAPGQLNFQTTSGNSNPPNQSLNISISGSGVLTWTATATTNNGGNWLAVNPASGTVSSTGPISQTAIVTATTGSLGIGTYTGNILFAASNYTQTISIPVTFTISPPQPTATPTSTPTPTTPTPSPTPVPGGGYTYYLPFLANQANQFTTYLAIQNSGTAAANVQIQYYDNSGLNIGNDSCSTLAVNGECLPNVLSTFQVNNSGTGVVTSNQPLNVIVAESTPFGGSAYAVNSGASNNLVAPLAINNAGGFNTRLSVFNGGSTPATATVRFYGQDGAEATLAARIVTIPPRQTTVLDQAQAGNGLPSSFYGWAQITSTVGSQLVAQVLEQNSNNHFVAIANAQANPQTTLYAPAIFNGAFGGFVTGSNIVNPNANPVTVTVTYHDASGAVPTLSGSQPTFRVLSAHSVVGVYDGAGNTGLPSQFYGSATISSTGGGVVMVVNEIGPALSTNSSESGTYPAIGAGSNTVSLPVIANGGFGYRTGLTILNTNNQAVSGVVTYYNLDGTAQGVTQNFSIGAFASQPFYQGAIPTLVGPNGTQFYGTAVIKVTSAGATNALIVTTNAMSAQFFYTYTEPTS